MEDEGRIMELESIPNDTENRQEEWYQQLSLDNVKAFIRSNIAAASRSFIAIGYYLNMPGTRNFMKRTATPAYGSLPGRNTESVNQPPAGT